MASEEEQPRPSKVAKLDGDSAKLYDVQDISCPNTSETVELDQELLLAFPVGYRHLAYLQSKVGYPVKKDMPGLKGPEVEALYATGADWLAGKQISWAGHTWGQR